VTGSPYRATGYEFERFLRQILERARDLETDTQGDYGSDGAADFVAFRDGRPLLITANVTTPQTVLRLKQNTAALGDALERYRELHPDVDPVPVLAIPGVLSESKATRAAKSGLEVWDGPYLRRRAWQLNVRIPPFVAYQRSSGLDHDRAADGGSLYTHALLDQLDSIRPGQAEWPAYQRYCENLLNFLFVPPLSPAIP
jgi:hypothetical protein